MKIADKTVIKNLGFCGNGQSSLPASVDVLGGKVVRVRPLHYDENYTKEEVRYWTIEKDGHVFEPGFKTLLPPFALAYKKRTYSPNRIPYPLKRVDWDPDGERNPQNRGKSKYVRISWDEACGIIASEIKRIHDVYGPNSILCQADGHGESKVYSGGHGCMVNMLNCISGCTTQARQPDSWEGWYWGAKYAWGMEPIGKQVQMNGLFRDIVENSDAVLFWGGDPETTPWGWGGQLPSRMCMFWDDIGIKSIFICPDLNYGAAVHADKWIPVLPNTDAALQLAIAHVWITEDLYDKDYIETHTVGFDWLESYVLGYVDGIEKTPKWAQEKCGVPSYTIKALARYWASHRVSIAHGDGGGMIRSAFSHEPARLEVALLAMQGLGKPGANQINLLGWCLFGLTTVFPVPLPETFTSVWAAYHGFSNVQNESFIVKTKIPQAILNPPVSWYGHTICDLPTVDQFDRYEFPLKGDAGVRMIWSDSPCWSTCWNGGNEFEDALRSESVEFYLVQHPWMENDCLFADLILPVSTLMECSDIANDNQSGFSLFFLEEQACEPVCDSRSDYEAVGEVAKALERYGGIYEGVYERYTEGLDQEGFFQRCFESSGIPGDFTYEDLQRQKFWMSRTSEGWETEPAGLIKFHDDPENNPLQTPSGKIELYSMRLADVWPDDTVRAPYPQWVEETEQHQDRKSSQRAKNYPFLLVSNHPRWRVHAQHDDIPWLREIETCKVVGPDGYAYEPVWINPVDAQALGIEDGDVVALFNERGKVLGGANVTERIMPGVISQEHGARLDPLREGVGGIDRGGANNLIAPSATTSENAAGEVTSGFLVGLEKVDVDELAQEYPQEFSRAYSRATGLVAEGFIVDGERAGSQP